MKVKVVLGNENSGMSVDVPRGGNIESILKRMKINPQAVIVKKNGAVVSEQETLKEKDTLRIIKVK